VVCFRGPYIPNGPNHPLITHAKQSWRRTEAVQSMLPLSPVTWTFGRNTTVTHTLQTRDLTRHKSSATSTNMIRFSASTPYLILCFVTHWWDAILFSFDEGLCAFRAVHFKLEGSLERHCLSIHFCLMYLVLFNVIIFFERPYVTWCIQLAPSRARTYWDTLYTYVWDKRTEDHYKQIAPRMMSSIFL
jgi:hypothetical protein